MIKKTSIIFLLIYVIVLSSCTYINVTKESSVSSISTDEITVSDNSLKFMSYDLLDEIIKSKFENNYTWLDDDYNKYDGRISIIKPLKLPIDLIISCEKCVFDAQIFKNENFDIDILYDDVNYLVISKDTFFGISIDEEYINSIIFSSKADYYIDVDFNIKNIEYDFLGFLNNLQSFCFYDNKYFSSNGDNISVQDQNFKIINSVSVNTGHSNSFQSSEDGYAYISGWDDNCVYEIDLNDLFINQKIELPTPKGYTTCAINKKSNEIYIFYREDYPTSIINYKMYTYNYATKTITNEKQTSFEFSVQQSCCYRDGFIYLLWGGSQKTNPNGLAIIDVNCNLVSTIHFESFDNYEPEGIYVVNNYNIYVSFSNNMLYNFRIV